MKKVLSVILAVLMLSGMCVSSDDKPPTDEKKIVFIVQYDMPNAERMEFNKGYNVMLKKLPPDSHVEFFFFIKDMVKKVQEGKPGDLTWPVIKPYFVVANTSTTPYKNLLHYMKEAAIQNQTVVFISTGISPDLRLKIDKGGFGRGKTVFLPQLYEPLNHIKDYCKMNNIYLIGLYVPGYRGPRVNRKDLFLDAFRYMVNQSGGKAYYNFNTFEGIFKKLAEKNLLFK